MHWKYRYLSFVVILVFFAIQFYLYKLQVTKSEQVFVSVKNSLNVYTSTKPQLSSTSVYLVDSSSCKIPYLDIFDKSILQFVRIRKEHRCSNISALTKVVYNVARGEHTLVVDNAAAKRFYSYSNWRCCVFTIRNTIYERTYYDSINETEGCFNKTMILDSKNQFVAVNCSKDGRGKFKEEIKVEPYTNIYAAVVKKKTAKERTSENNKILNVLLLGFDSMSRLNLYRAMPRTVNWLQRNKWVELRGYNKIGDNTLPNLMAILTGLSPDNFRTHYKSPMDDYPYIWKNFSRAGYVTAYAEDEAHMSTFAGYLKGFLKPPTDHFLYDFLLPATSPSFQRFTPPEQKMRGCVGLKSYTEHVLDYALDFVNVYKNNFFFGLFWINQFSHNNFNGPSAVDAKIEKFFRKVKSSGTLNSTLFVFLSDHGLRLGKTRKTRIGWYEDRLPFLFISIPEWFKQESKVEYSNLMVNENRLSTPYDLHMTLIHVLRGSAPSVPLPACLHCRSLLLPLPVNRSCAEAGISPHWCACHDSQPVDLDDAEVNLSTLANMVVAAINERLLEVPQEDKNPFLMTCEILSLGEVLYARKKVDTGHPEYVIAVKTIPGNAEFEATVLLREGYFYVDYPISRINKYDKESLCIDNPILKEFCFCGIEYY